MDYFNLKNALSFTTLLVGLMCSTLFADQIEKDAPRDYSKIRDALMLPSGYKTKITDIDHVRKYGFYKKMTRDKIQYSAKNTHHFAYASEGVDDSHWGCAWRAIQTTLSAHYEGETNEVPEFKELFTTYGSREFLEEQLSALYPEIDDEWLAPHEDWHMWADPVVGHMIFHSLGMKSQLIALNAVPKLNSPMVADEIVNFDELKEHLLLHFRKGGYPIVYDNGSYALNILGVGESDGRFYLLIADPHIRRDRTPRPMNGVYVVGLNSKGHRVSIEYPAIQNHLDHDSYQSIDFSKKSSVLLLFSKS